MADKPKAPKGTDTNYSVKGNDYWREWVKLSTGRKMVYGKNYADWKQKATDAIADDVRAQLGASPAPKVPQNGDTNYITNGHKYWREWVSLSTGRKMVYGKNYGDWKRKAAEAIADDAKGLISIKDTIGQAFVTWFYSVYENSPDIKDSTFIHRENQYLNHLKNDPVMKVRLRDVTELHMRKMIDRKKEKGCTKAQLESAVIPLKMLFRYCVSEGYVRRDPLRNIKMSAWDAAPREEIKVFSDEEFKAIIEKTDDIMYRFLFFCAMGTGARSGELSAANHGDIENGIFRVRRSMTKKRTDAPGKSTIVVGDSAKTKKSSREIPMSGILQMEYRKYKTWCQEEKFRRGGGKLLDTDPLFLTVSGCRTTSAGINKELKQACILSDIEYRSLHKMRDTFITKLVQAGTPLATVMEIAGHKKVETTLRYFHVEMPYKQKALEIIDEVLRM